MIPLKNRLKGVSHFPLCTAPINLAIADNTIYSCSFPSFLSIQSGIYMLSKFSLVWLIIVAFYIVK